MTYAEAVQRVALQDHKLAKFQEALAVLRRAEPLLEAVEGILPENMGHAIADPRTYCAALAYRGAKQPKADRREFNHLIRHLQAISIGAHEVAGSGETYPDDCPDCSAIRDIIRSVRECREAKEKQ